MKWSIASIRSLAGSELPAIALMEAIVAAAVLALSCGLFLGFLTNAAGQQARAKEQELLIAIAQSQRSQSFVPGLSSGNMAEVSWRKSCTAEIADPMARLGLLHCELTLRRRLQAPVVLKWSQVEARGNLE